VDHRLVVHREQLFADTDGYWPQSRTGASRKNDALHETTLMGIGPQIQSGCEDADWEFTERISS
jgi:hypothetical protein